MEPRRHVSRRRFLAAAGAAAAPSVVPGRILVLAGEAAPSDKLNMAAIAAMQLGMHVMVEKPLAHNVYECYKLAEVARKKKDWLHAIKTGGKSACDFAEYAVYLGVAAVLWEVSFKLGRKIEWDGEKMCVPNCPEADPFIRRAYRKGWEL
jgi:hypothetical protein